MGDIESTGVQRRWNASAKRMLAIAAAVVAMCAMLLVSGCSGSEEEASDDGSDTGSATEDATETTDDEVEAEEAEEPLLPELVETGYYVSEDDYGDTYIYVGVGWTNPNEGYEIQYPEVMVTGYDADGTVTFTETQTMNSLMPGETQYFGFMAGEGADTETVEFSIPALEDYCYVETDEQAQEHYTISNTSESTDEYGATCFTGEIIYDTEAIDEFGDEYTQAWVSVILRDAEGNIVYGDNGFADLGAVGETSAFELDEYGLPEYDSYEIYAIPWL